MEEVETLIIEARASGREPLGRLLELYRNYLTILATAHFDRRLRQRMNPSDLVQETLLAAHRDFPSFYGSNERQFLAWLRQILINCWHHSIDAHVKSKKRDVRAEVPLDRVSATLDNSAINLLHMLADRGPSPSAAVQQRERSAAFANELAKLRPQYRDVIMLRNLQGLTFEEIADRMHRKPGAVRMLWLRAIEKLKDGYQPADES